VLSLWDGESCTIVRSGFDVMCCVSRILWVVCGGVGWVVVR